MKILHAAGHAPSLLHQTGEKDCETLASRYREAGIAAEVRAFIDDMASAYRGAALVVARAGASTLAELTLGGLPSILIPLPTAADDHQTVNARELENAGAARALAQRDTAPAVLAAAVRTLFVDVGARGRMAAAASRLAKPRAHADIADRLELLAGLRQEVVHVS
jgi:UDP-N-acetylglucosamine--N-acetylmuramyl-(pentapeptide) pyrophosphoryl-undecaprenol N-acetylglucosamine transferase